MPGRPKRRPTAVLVAAAVLAAVLATCAAAASPSPAALYRALLAHPLGRKGLPAGLVPIGQKGQLGGPPAHAYGLVSVLLRPSWARGDAWGIEYDVYPTPAAASAHLRQVLAAHPELKRPAPGLGKDSALAYLGRATRDCEIYAELVSGNVYVHVSTAFEASQCRRDRTRLLKLARAALDHVNAVRAGLA